MRPGILQVEAPITGHKTLCATGMQNTTHCMLMHALKSCLPALSAWPKCSSGTQWRMQQLSARGIGKSLSMHCCVSFLHPGCLCWRLTRYISRVVELVFDSNWILLGLLTLWAHGCAFPNLSSSWAMALALVALAQQEKGAKARLLSVYMICCALP